MNSLEDAFGSIKETVCLPIRTIFLDIDSEEKIFKNLKSSFKGFFSTYNDRIVIIL